MRPEGIRWMLFSFYAGAAAFLLAVCAVMLWLILTGRRDFNPALDTLGFTFCGTIGLFAVHMAVSSWEAGDE